VIIPRATRDANEGVNTGAALEMTRDAVAILLTPGSGGTPEDPGSYKSADQQQPDRQCDGGGDEDAGFEHVPDNGLNSLPAHRSPPRAIHGDPPHRPKAPGREDANRRHFHFGQMRHPIQTGRGQGAVGNK
jgi:hypothetical protein